MWDDYAKSIGTTANNLTQAQKIQAEVNGILEETRFQTGDAAKLVNTYSGQLAMLGYNFQKLKVAVGNALIPIAQAVLPGINAIIAAFTKLANVFAKVTAMLFGKSTTVKKTTDVESSAGAAAGATDKLAESTEGMGEASKQAAKDMKGVQAGFDELNILAGKASSSMEDAAGGMGDISGAADLEIPEFEADAGNFDEFEKEFSSLGELFVDTLDKMLAAMPDFRNSLLDFADNFNEFNQKLYDAFTFPGVVERVEELGRELARAFNDLVNAIDWELWGRTLGAGLNLGLQFLTEFIYTFDWINLGKKLAEFINGLVDEVDWYDFGRLLWAKFKIALETFAGFITGLDMPALAQAASDIIMGFFDSMTETIAKIDWAEIGRQIAEFLNNVDWIGVITSIAGALESMVEAALELVAGFIQNADAGTLVAAALILGMILLKKLISTVIMPIAKEVASNLIKKISESITSSGVTGMLDGVGKAVLGIGAVIAGVGIAASGFFSMWNNGFSAAREAVMLVGIAITAIGTIFLGVSAPIAGAVALVVAVVGTLVAAIHGAGEAAYKSSDDFKVMEKILDECEDSSKRSENALKNLESNIENLSVSMANIGAAQQLVDEIYAINENANASAYELELMATKVELLNSMGLDGLHLTIDETTGRIVETKEATDQLIASLQKEAETAALQELIVQAYKDRYQAVADAEEAVKNINVAEQALNETEKKLTDTPWWDFQKHAELTAQQEKQTKALEAATDARDKAITAYEELSGAIDTYSGALTDLEEPEASVGVKLEERMDSVRETVEDVAADMPGYGKNISEGLENGMSDGLKEEKTKSIFGKIGDWFKSLFGINSPSKVFEEFGGFLMAGLHNGLEGKLEPINQFFSDLWENVQQLASDAWDGIVSIWETVSGWFDENIIQPVAEFFGDLWDGIREGASELWDKVVSVWEKAGDWFKTNVTDPIGDAFEAVGEFIKGVFNGIIGTVEGMINGVIKGINWLIEQLNKIKIDIPEGVPLVGGTKFGINIQKVSDVKLPRLANGAVIPPNQQFAAILGDQRSGMNIEAPLPVIEQALQNVWNRNGGMGGIADVNVNFTGSLSQLARILQPAITVEIRRKGINLAEVRS